MIAIVVVRRPSDVITSNQASQMRKKPVIAAKISESGEWSLGNSLRSFFGA
jgi:hypothetical protein